MKLYHRRRTCSHTSPCRLPTMSIMKGQAPEIPRQEVNIVSPSSPRALPGWWMQPQDSDGTEITSLFLSQRKNLIRLLIMFDENRGRYHGGRRPSSKEFHIPTIIPPSALNKRALHHPFPSPFPDPPPLLRASAGRTKKKKKKMMMIMIMMVMTVKTKILDSDKTVYWHWGSRTTGLRWLQCVDELPFLPQPFADDALMCSPGTEVAQFRLPLRNRAPGITLYTHEVTRNAWRLVGLSGISLLNNDFMKQKSWSS